MENPLQASGEGNPEDDGGWISSIQPRISLESNGSPIESGGWRRQEAAREKIEYIEYLMGLITWKINAALHNLIELL